MKSEGGACASSISVASSGMIGTGQCGNVEKMLGEVLLCTSLLLTGSLPSKVTLMTLSYNPLVVFLSLTTAYLIDVLRIQWRITSK